MHAHWINIVELNQHNRKKIYHSLLAFADLASITRIDRERTIPVEFIMSAKGTVI